MKTEQNGPVRVRFPPSPTGFLHVGGARTAIYNDLLRRNLGGALVLRIEDTDRARSDEAMTRQIISALTWLGVNWDEGPHLQSDGLERHRAAADRLVQEGKAYPCFCTPESLEKQREEAQRNKTTFRYPRTCADYSAEEVERRRAGGEAEVIRLRLPDGPVRFQDLVAGDVEFPEGTLDDFILLRSDRSPTYHLSVVCDDIEMGMTHVIRGDDHLSNTPKHVVLFLALGAELPIFGHLPLILGPDRKRLSKRTGAASVEEFREEGILPEALYNYLALLGWSPGDDREIMSREEMAQLFTVERLGNSAAVFDHDKLAWMNAQYMNHMSMDQLMDHLTPFLAEAGLAEADPARVRQLVELYRVRARTLKELAPLLAPYFKESLEYRAEGCVKFFKAEGLPEHLEALIASYAQVEPFDIESTDQALRALAENLGIKAGILIHATRMALTTEKKGPPLFDVVEAMGREGALRHLRNFQTFLRTAEPPA